MIFQHNVFYMKRTDDRAGWPRRYLDSVKRGLIDEHYLENELRLAHLADCVERGKPPDHDRLRDPVRHDADGVPAAAQALRRTGAPAPGSTDAGRASTPTRRVGRVALDQLQRRLDAIRDDRRPRRPRRLRRRARRRRDLHAGVPRRARARRLRRLGRRPFRAAADDGAGHRRPTASRASAPTSTRCATRFERFDLLDDRVRFLQGDLDATLPDAPIERLALLHLGPALGACGRDRARAAVPAARGRAGVVVVDDDRRARGRGRGRCVPRRARHHGRRASAIGVAARAGARPSRGGRARARAASRRAGRSPRARSRRPRRPRPATSRS